MRTRARLLTFAVPLGIMTAVCWGAWADDSGRGDNRGQMRLDEPLVLKKKIDVGGKGLGAFDISFVDPKIELYVFFRSDPRPVVDSGVSAGKLQLSHYAVNRRREMRSRFRRGGFSDFMGGQLVGG